MRLRVLGVDPGLTRCGLGVVDGPVGSPSTVAMQVVRTAADLPIERRLAALHVAVADVIDRHRPDVVACEQVLFSTNARTAMGVGQAAGVALLAAAQAGLRVASYTPTDVKLTVAGHGTADKRAVARMVAAQLKLVHRPRPADVSDALAVALCHLARAGRGAPDDQADAAARLRSAEAVAKADGPRDWEAVLDRPHVRAAGGTGGQR